VYQRSRVVTSTTTTTTDALAHPRILWYCLLVKQRWSVGMMFPFSIVPVCPLSPALIYRKDHLYNAHKSPSPYSSRGVEGALR